MFTKQQTKFALLGAITSILPFAGVASAATSGVGGVVLDSANSHAYELVLDPAASWSQAESTARGAGGYLVTPTSQSEDAFVDQILLTNNAPTGSYWMGLTREPGQLVGGGTGTGSGTKAASQFYFVTDEPVTYANWGPSLPDNFAGHGGQRLDQVDQSHRRRSIGRRSERQMERLAECRLFRGKWPVQRRPDSGRLCRGMGQQCRGGGRNHCVPGCLSGAAAERGLSVLDRRHDRDVRSSPKPNVPHVGPSGKTKAPTNCIN